MHTLAPAAATAAWQRTVGEDDVKREQHVVAGQRAVRHRGAVRAGGDSAAHRLKGEPREVARRVAAAVQGDVVQEVVQDHAGVHLRRQLLLVHHDALVGHLRQQHVHRLGAVARAHLLGPPAVAHAHALRGTRSREVRVSKLPFQRRCMSSCPSRSRRRSTRAPARAWLAPRLPGCLQRSTCAAGRQREARPGVQVAVAAVQHKQPGGAARTRGRPMRTELAHGHLPWKLDKSVGMVASAHAAEATSSAACSMARAIAARLQRRPRRARQAPSERAPAAAARAGGAREEGRGSAVTRPRAHGAPAASQSPHVKASIHTWLTWITTTRRSQLLVLRHRVADVLQRIAKRCAPTRTQSSRVSNARMRSIV